MGGSPVNLDPVVIPLIEGPTVLDVGCGFGKWGSLFWTNYWETFNPRAGTLPEVVGCDGHLRNVEMASRNGSYKECRHLRFPPLPFDDLSFDTVLMIEVIEHLSDEEGAMLIAEAKRIAGKRVILSTPNFPDFREGHETLTGFNELDAHLSYWTQARLRRLGFKVYGSGVKSRSRYVRGVLRKLRLLSWFDNWVRPAFGGISLLVPVIAENTVAVWIRK